MKLSLKGFQKKHYIVTGVLVVGLAAGGLVAALNQPQQTGADTSPLTTEVDRQGQELSNHEARISNLENNQKDIQNNTNTPASSTQVSVPAANTKQTVVSTPSQPSDSSTPDPTPSPTIITIVSYSKGQIDPQGHYVCHLVNSDGSTQDITDFPCDDSIIGMAKPSVTSP